MSFFVSLLFFLVVGLLDYNTQSLIVMVSLYHTLLLW